MEWSCSICKKPHTVIKKNIKAGLWRMVIVGCPHLATLYAEEIHEKA